MSVVPCTSVCGIHPILTIVFLENRARRGQCLACRILWCVHFSGWGSRRENTTNDVVEIFFNFIGLFLAVCRILFQHNRLNIALTMLARS